MRDFRDAKAMAHALREALTRNGVETTHSQSLELIAKAFGYDNWNILSARIEAAQPRAIDTEASPAAGQEPMLAKILYCSFCGKSQHDVRRLIAGPSVYICDECVELCVDIVRDGILWRVLSRLRASEENASDAYQAVLEHVRSQPTEEVASYVEQSKVGVSHNRLTLHLIDRRLALRDGEVPQADDALASPLFARLKTKSKEELGALRKNTQRELTHYEDAFAHRNDRARGAQTANRFVEWWCRVRSRPEREVSARARSDRRICGSADARRTSRTRRE